MSSQTVSLKEEKSSALLRYTTYFNQNKMQQVVSEILKFKDFISLYGHVAEDLH